MQNFGRVVLIVVVLLFAASASAVAGDEPLPYAHRIAFNKSQVNAEDKTRIMLYTSKVSIFPQFNQPAMFVQNTTAQGSSGAAAAAALGNLLGALLMNHFSAADRDAAVAFNHQLEAVLATIDINNEIKASVQAELSKTAFFKKIEFESVEHVNELSQAGLLTRIEEPTILTLATQVHFDEGLKTLCLGSSIKIWRKNEVQPIYFSDLNYTSAYQHASKDDELRKRWVANDGELLKEKIREGIAEVTRLLVQELSASHSSESDSNFQLFIETLNPKTNKKVQAPFYVQEDMPDRLVGRLGAPDSSLLASIPKANVTLKSPK